MTIALAIIAATAVAGLVLQHKHFLDALERREEAHADERARLLNREPRDKIAQPVTHPADNGLWSPEMDIPERDVVVPEPDERDLVGTIQTDAPEE